MKTPLLNIVLLILLLSCQEKKRTTLNNKNDSNYLNKSNKILSNEDTVHQKQEDSLNSLYYQDKLYFSTIIRLKPNTKFFIYSLALKEPNYLIDSANREEYYNNSIKKITSKELEVHKKIWSYSEIQKMQQGDGGYLTLVTWIDGFPSKEDPYYHVAIKRNMITHLTTSTDIGWVKVKDDLTEVRFCDAIDCYKPIDWNKKKNDL